jgi:predicted dienelactone hydrolase
VKQIRWHRTAKRLPWKWLKRRLQPQLWGLSMLGAVLMASPAAAAERLIISYGALERSIPIGDLEQFATTGEMTRQLSIYANQLGISEERLQQIRDLLITPADLDNVAVAQFLYTEQGKLLLKQLSRIIQTPSRQAGFSATRAALILAATEGDLTLLNVLQTFPTEAIRIDLVEGLAVAQSLERAILKSEAAVDLVQDLSAQEAMAAPEADFNASLQLLQETRAYGVSRGNVVVPGVAEPVELYIPRVLAGSPPPPTNGFPLVIISHGLGSNSSSFDYLAGYLATGGIAVAAIEHAGSNDQQISDLLTGSSNNVVPDEEFIRRPQDVSLTLDTLSQLEETDPSLRGLLDMSRIGLVGQSFGGYTGLALAGADFDLEGLGRQCPPDIFALNPSLLLQCQALRLGNPDGNLADSRIRSLLIINPIGSLLFGENGYAQVDLPTMVVGGTADTVAPVFPEQIQPYTWMPKADHYLVLVDRGTHFSAIGDVAASDQPINIPPELVGPRPDLVQSYIQVLGLAFFKLTLEQDQRFQPMVQAAFVEMLGIEPHPLSLTTTLTAEDLNAALE